MFFLSEKVIEEPGSDEGQQRVMWRKRARSHLRSTRTDLAFPCPDCQEQSFNKAAGLDQDRIRYCPKSDMRNRKKTSHARTRQTKVDQPFLCLHCKECSYASAARLLAHVKKLCQASKGAGGQEINIGAQQPQHKRGGWRGWRRESPFLCPDCGESSFSNAARFHMHRDMYRRKTIKRDNESREGREEDIFPEEALVIDGTGEEALIKDKTGEEALMIEGTG